MLRALRARTPSASTLFGTNNTQVQPSVHIMPSDALRNSLLLRPVASAEFFCNNLDCSAAGRAFAIAAKQNKVEQLESRLQEQAATLVDELRSAATT